VGPRVSLDVLEKKKKSLASSGSLTPYRPLSQLVNVPRVAL
jgi:hypothetical protein